MISSASTLLLLATLVFNAALVLGAPIRMDTVQPVARAEISTPVVQPVARAAIVDVQDNRRRSLLGRVSRRSARLVSERDVPLSAVVVEVREPVEAVAHAVEARERRYPRRYIHDFYKRDPATSVKETLTYKKTTVHDTPADAAAYEYGVLDNEHHGKKHHSSGEKHNSAADKTGPTVPPGLPTDAPNVSTTVTVSTIIPDAPAASSAVPSPDATAVVPTLSAADPAAATPVATTPVASAPVAETPAPGTPTDVPASGSSSVPAEPQSTPVTPVAGTPDATTPDAGAPASSATTSTAAQAVPTDAVPVADPNAPASGTPTATTDSSAPTATTTATTDSSSPTATTTDAAGAAPTADASATSSTTSSAATATATATDASGAAPTPDATSNTTPDDSASANTPPSRRSVSRRTLAVSGASWASAVRRQLN